MKKKKSSWLPLGIRFRSHLMRSDDNWKEDSNKEWRVWQSNWSFDQFEIVSHEQLRTIELTCKILNIPFTDYDIEERD